MSSDHPMLLVANAQSGNASDAVALLEAFCARAPERRQLKVLSGEEIASAEWLPEERSLVVACGGDGTLALCANRLVGTDHVLGLLPLGTLNIYARRAGISLEIERALEQLVAGADRPVDVARAGDTLFLNSVIVGLYPRLVAMRERWRSDHAHWPTGLRWFVDTARAALWTLVNWRRSSFALELDGASLSGRYITFAVTNNALSFQLEETDLCEGRLWVYLPGTLGRLEHLRLFVLNIFARAEEIEPLETRRVQEVLVHVPDGTHYSIDGEARRISGSLRLRMDPGALTMRLPPERTEP